MKCIYCNKRDTSVINSRPYQGGVGVWRRRKCGACSRIFTTREIAFADNLFVIKKNKKRQRFMYEKMFTSIVGALNTKKNNDNGTNAKLAKNISEEVIRKMLKEMAQGEVITTRMLIKAIYQELKKRGRLYADTYIYYSEYRLQTALTEKLISLDK